MNITIHQSPDAIITFSRRFGVPPTAEGWRKAVNKNLDKGGVPMRLRSVDATSAAKAAAYVDKGNWWAKCPARDCWGIEFVDPAAPLFFCCSCLNREFGGAPLWVEFPPEQAEIERLLLRRPNPLNRNWRPHNTLADLRVDNAINGIWEV